MRLIQRLAPFVAVCLILFSFNVNAAPKDISVEETGNATVVNINTATLDELESLKGIGESKAQAIIAYRDDQGKFKSVNDLSNVKGISDSTIATLMKKNPDRIVAK